MNPFYDICDNHGTELEGSVFGTAFGGLNEPKATKLSDVSVSNYHSIPQVSVNYHSTFYVDSIKDMILIEDYMSDDTKTPEEFVNYIADKINS